MRQRCRLHLNQIHTTGITRNLRCQVSPHHPRLGFLDRPQMAGMEYIHLLIRITQSEITATLLFRLDSCLIHTLPAGRQVVGKAPRRILTRGISSPQRSPTKVRLGQSSGMTLRCLTSLNDDP